MFGIRRFAAAILIPGLMLSLAPSKGTAQTPGRDEESRRTVTVTASGSVRAVPDMVMISTGVQTTGETARSALLDNSTVMRRVIERLKKIGIRSRDIATDNLSVRPVYQRNRKNNQPPEVTGYQVDNSVRIQVRDISLMGDVLDQVVKLGANQIGGIQFKVREAERLKDDARTKAMDNARRHARLLAREANTDLGKVLMIREGTASYSPGPRMMEMRTSAAVPVQAGTRELSTSVTVTWELR